MEIFACFASLELLMSTWDRMMRHRCGKGRKLALQDAVMIGRMALGDISNSNNQSSLVNPLDEFSCE